MVTGRVLPKVLAEHDKIWGGLEFLNADDLERLKQLCKTYCRSPKSQIQYLIKRGMVEYNHALQKDEVLD